MLRAQKNTVDLVASGIQTNVPGIDSSIPALNSYLELVNSVIQRLKEERFLSLCKMNDSPSFIEREANSILQFRRNAERQSARAQQAVQQMNSVNTEKAAIYAESQEIIQKSRFIQQCVEKDISKRYEGRRVNIMGGAQTLRL